MTSWKRLAALAFGLTATAVHAGESGTLTYGPHQPPIPVVGGVGLVVLGLLLAFVAIRVLRSGQGGTIRSMMVFLVAAGALGSGAVGVQWISDARADPPPFDWSLSNPSGGTALIWPGVNLYTNDTERPVVILEIDLNNELVCASEPGDCAEGTVLGPDQNCQLTCDFAN